MSWIPRLAELAEASDNIGPPLMVQMGARRTREGMCTASLSRAGHGGLDLTPPGFRALLNMSLAIPSEPICSRAVSEVRDLGFGE